MRINRWLEEYWQLTWAIKIELIHDHVRLYVSAMFFFINKIFLYNRYVFLKYKITKAFVYLKCTEIQGEIYRAILNESDAAK